MEEKRTNEELIQLLDEGKAIRCPNCDAVLTNVNKACPECGFSDILKLQRVARRNNLHYSSDGTLGPESSYYSTNSTIIEKNHEVNPVAEGVANGVAGFLFYACIIIATVFLGYGIYTCSNIAAQAGLPLIGAAVAIFIVGLISWATIKLFVNISRNLYNIDDSIRNLYRLIEKKK